MPRHPSRSCTLAVLAALAAAAARAAVPVPAEPECLAVLRSDRPAADKALACKQLAVHGTAAAVPDLAKLLGDERLTSWARIALEAIPGPEADAALRSAVETLSGRPLVGVINSIGVRRDSGAIALLAARLADADAETAAAAAAALGRIGTPEAAVPLGGALGAGTGAADAVAEACVVCAERLAAEGRASEAGALYDAVRGADVSEQRQAEAARGAILVRGPQGLPLLIELLHSPSRRLSTMGLSTARELGAADAELAAAVDRALVAEVSAAAAAGAIDRATLVIAALADRAGAGARTTLQESLVVTAASGPKPLRLAAIDALGRAGGASSVGPLLDVAADPDPGYAIAVRATLATLPGADVDREVARRLATATADRLPLLVELVGDRRIGTGAEILPLVDHADERVRLAALAALGSVVGQGDLGTLVKAAVAPRDDVEKAVARAALAEAAVRMPDRDACADLLAAAAVAAPVEPRTTLLETMAQVGGPRALAAIAAAARDDDVALQDAATRLLGTWMTADAAPVLLELAGPDAPGKYRSRALRGAIRIARQFALPVAERAALCRAALGVAREQADREAVLDVLERYPAPETLAVAREAAAVTGLEERTTAAIAAIEAKLPWLEFAGGDGPGKGKRVVLVSGDEEYRSEEALTQLAKILATHHGFDCTVLYAIDPATGEISPNKGDNIPGLEALREADLMVIATRFRNLPDEQMKEIDDYLKRGGPVIGMRTATHAFNIPKERAYAHYGNGYGGDKKDWADGFGRLVLGEKWISHHGHHGKESTRGIAAPDAKGHPILRGIADGDIWGPTDVYGVRLPLPGDSRPLVLGQVLTGMKPDDPPVEGKKNDPMMPVAWTKTYSIDGGPRGRVFTTTMGAATDLAAEGTRRLLVNACYWATGLEDGIPEKSCVDVVGTFEPTPFGFNGAKKGLKPADLR